MRSEGNTTLKERTIILGLNAVAGYLVFAATSHRLLPSGGLESVWYVSALSFWFLSLLSAPWFVPPRDAIVASITAIVILITMDLGMIAQFQWELNLLRWLAVGYGILVTVLALSALFSLSNDRASTMGIAATRLTAAFGRGELVFTPPALLSIIASYQFSPVTMCWLVIAWVLFVVGKPFDKLATVWGLFQLETKSATTKIIGELERIDDPNIVRVKLSSSGTWHSNRLHAVSMADGTQRYVVALFSQERGSEIVGTGLCVGVLQEPLSITPGAVVSTHNEKMTAEFMEKHSGMAGANLVGFVVENSSIGVIRFEVATETALSQGAVVFLQLAGQIVFYQILDAQTSEESFEQNPRGTHIVTAAQVGAYSSKTGFDKYPWLPRMNSPVFMSASPAVEPPEYGSREFHLATVPGTQISVGAKIDELVNYHTAVLGVTGTGKTELTLDIVREALSRGVKVFCVDFTGQYRDRLDDIGPHYPGPTPKETADIEQKMRAVDHGAYKAEKEKKALDDALEALKESTFKQVADFLEDTQKKLAIFELAEITSTRATLRITELYLSSIMSWAKAHKRQQQVLIVLEEAHTIIPETGGAGFDFDTQWVVGRIGQIALQGRKFGVGLLVVSQRTALVSKTVLSQCNTFLTHALIDQTSLSFLESVYSSQHARLIPNLGRFEFLAYGKGVRAERPIILKREFDKAKFDASMGVKAPEKEVVVAESEVSAETET